MELERKMNQSKEPQQEQMENGRPAISTALLVRMAHHVSKRKFLHFYLPCIVVVALILGGCKFLLEDGMERNDAIAIAVMVFAFYSWFAVVAVWAPQGEEFLAHIEFMFGHKTREGVLDMFQSGEAWSGGLNVMQIAKSVGEYEGSKYVELKFDAVA